MAMTGSTIVCLPQRSGPLAVRPPQDPMEAIPEPSGAELDAVRALILLSGAIAQYGWYRGRCWLRFSSHLWGGGVFYFVTILKER